MSQCFFCVYVSSLLMDFIFLQRVVEVNTFISNVVIEDITETVPLVWSQQVLYLRFIESQMSSSEKWLYHNKQEVKITEGVTKLTDQTHPVLANKLWVMKTLNCWLNTAVERNKIDIIIFQSASTNILYVKLTT